MIHCISTYSPALKPASEAFSFPVAPWVPNYAERAAYEDLPCACKTIETLLSDKRTLEARLDELQNSLNEAHRVLQHPAIRMQRKLYHAIKFWK